ncbi:hypothetical protein CO019_01855 [Candidatus Berkelbacteria bacterium CG_4_9_14_0_2_um_filter_42_30]|uniref:Uncharacterized protein n=2 Tax=Candidatus Berkelbacteria TaxID=1618330 RepID=A0A2H0PZU4_9BACT|nr:MAG: hypothetical protein COV40_00010 [Candidatus Berkelbacteria bacterium CG11_big_fil_rev_8_21_14_0_20_42_15]PJC65590.1 MAG: hypothetical protein CO019_01855 [Candidatus Berkelbacteria bacterium CG_4_9_14_0_2_um_filter_42_30]
MKNFEIACPPLAEAGKKEGGWGEGPEGVASQRYGVKIFARPRFSAGASISPAQSASRSLA